jgi:ataxin-3
MFQVLDYYASSIFWASIVLSRIVSDSRVPMLSCIPFVEYIPLFYLVRMSDLRVYFEKQVDRLCGVHCLNSLLQGPIFSQSELNKYAAELDKEESALFVADPNQPKPPRSMTISSLSNRPKSHNVDDTGYFSLGVLEKALLSKYNLSVENAARRDIIQQINRDGFESHDGFVIHLRDHWFSARAIPNPNYPGVREWFFLDSLKPGPIPITENDLWGTLQGLIQSGDGFVFVVTGGRLPFPMQSSAKPVLRANQFYLTREEIKKRQQQGEASNGDQGSYNFTVVDPKAKQPVITDWSKLGSGHSLSGQALPARSPEDDELQRAIQASMRSNSKQMVPPEPSSSEPSSNLTTVLVRFPSGQRHVRKFALNKDTVEGLFGWLESLSPEGGSSARVALVGTMDMRGWKLSRSSVPSFSYSLVLGSGTEEESIMPIRTLVEVGLRSGQEAFNLQI